MKIGIFGGAFNPPHVGHTVAAKNAAIEQGLDLLVVIPTGISPHKPMPQGTPTPEMRLAMVINAFQGLLPNISISDIEIYSFNRNYTIDTITALQKQFHNASLYLLVGNDMYDSLDTWKDSAALKETVTPVLLPRNVVDISSTQVRSQLPNREGVSFVAEDNYSLIIKHRLYGAKPNWDWLRNQAHSMLDPSRIAHVLGCETAAVQLAERWGESVEDAREAAILHDITKKLDFCENMCIISESGLVTKSYKEKEAKLLHSVTAGILAKTTFGMSDRVARAIRLHTTGSAGMSLLDKIIYVADYIEQTRVFPGVETLRQAAFEDIDKAMAMGLQMTVSDLNTREIEVDTSTLEAISDLSR